MSNLFDSTIPKFLLVGVINTVVGAGVMFLLYNWFHCSYWIAATSNYIVGGSVSFFLNKYFTFQCKEWDWSQVVRFVVNLLVCYVSAYWFAREVILFMLRNCDLWIQDNVAMVVGMCLYTVLNYFGQRFLTFTKKA